MTLLSSWGGNHRVFFPLPGAGNCYCRPWWTCRTVRSKQAKYISGWKDLWNFQIKFHVDQFIKWRFPHCSLPILHILCVNNILEYLGFFSAIVWMRMYQLPTLKSQDINSWELPANAEGQKQCCLSALPMEAGSNNLIKAWAKPINSLVPFEWQWPVLRGKDMRGRKSKS